MLLQSFGGGGEDGGEDVTLVVVTNASSIAMSLAHVQSVLCCGLAHTCACDQHRRVGKAITSPIAGTVLAASSVALVLAPSPEPARSAASSRLAGRQRKALLV